MEQDDYTGDLVRVQTQGFSMGWTRQIQFQLTLQALFQEIVMALKWQGLWIVFKTKDYLLIFMNIISLKDG